MEIPVIVEPVGGLGYRAIGAGGLSVGLTAEGATAAEAVDRLAKQIQSSVRAGATLAEVSVASDAPPGSRMPDACATIPFMRRGVRRWRTIVASWTKTPRRYKPL